MHRVIYSIGCLLFLFSTGACAAGGGPRTGDRDASAADTSTTDAPGLDAGGADAPTVDGTMADSGMPMTDGGPDAGGTDSGPFDGGATDAGDDAGDAGCSRDDECDDANACNGEETCVGGVCMAGTPIECTDGIACTIDGCDSRTGMCTFTGDDTMCAGTLICSSTGCVDPGCGESPCALVSPQCGCPAGQGCYLTPMDERVCVPAGTADVGEACSGDEICSPGNICIDLDGDAGSLTVCRAFCDADADCAGPGSLCLATVTGTMQQICTVDCDPITHAGCPAGTGCGIFTQEGTGRRLTDCDPVGSGTQGAACTGGGDCAAGFDCIDVPTGGSQCLQLCRRSPVGGECAPHAGTSCVRLGADGLVFNGTEYGVCF